MLLSSMTGFARKSGHCTFDNAVFDWVWELRSVNGKGLDIKTKLPAGTEISSIILKDIAQRHFERGSLSVSLTLTSNIDKPCLKINQDLLQQVTIAAVDLYRQHPDVLQLPAPADLMQIKGVVEIEQNSLSEEDSKRLNSALFADFGDCCAALAESRQREGQKIKTVLLKMIDTIAGLTNEIAALAANTPKLLRQKLTQQIAELTNSEFGISEDRIAQEILLLVNRADIREETDRLNAHIKTARQMLEDNQTLGRRLDFLCQEFNRETNTICSKAFDIEIINRGMELKVVIEQLREQVQNME